MHIALVSTFYYPRMHGGTEQSLQYQAEAHAKKGLRVTVISFHDGDKPERFTHNGVDCITLPVPNFSQCLDGKHRTSATVRSLWHVIDIYNPVAGRLLEKILRELKPDLVQTHNLPGWSCAAWSACRRLDLPNIQVLHDFQLTCPTATRFRDGENCKDTCMKCVPFGILRKRFSQRVNFVIANSNYTRELHRSLGYFSAAKIFEVIYGAVPPPVISQEETRRSDQTIRIGYIGRLHSTKGIELLMESYMAVARKDLVLRIAGSGPKPYEAELRKKAQGAAIEFLGHTPASDFFQSIDLLVVPSLWNEPMGRVAIEAANHGVAVVAAKRGGIPELVKDGKTGWIFDPSIPGELAGILGKVTRDQIQALRSNCLAWGQTFSAEKTSDQWISLYTKALNIKRNSASSFVPEILKHEPKP